MLEFCYNCKAILRRDFYLMVTDIDGNQYLYDDVQPYIVPTDRIWEFDICADCGASI